LDSLHSVDEKRGKVLGMRRSAVGPDQQWTGAVPGEPSLRVGIESAAIDGAGVPHLSNGSTLEEPCGWVHFTR